MMAIIRREIRDRKNSLIAYCIIALVLLWMYTALFPSIAASSKQLEKLFQSYPKGVFQAMGIQDLSFNTLEKYLSVEMFSFMWPILAILFAVSRAGNAISGEIEKGTLGLYLSLPVSRFKIYLSKYASVLILMTVFIIASILGIIPLAAIYKQPVSEAHILSLSAISLLFMWVIFVASLMLSAIFSERSKVYTVIGAVLVMMYAANVIASLKSGLGWLHKVSIFYYYNSQDILSKGGIRVSSLVVFIGAIAVFTIFGALVFSRRDVSN